LTRTNGKADPIEAEVSGLPFPMKSERRVSALITASFFRRRRGRQGRGVAAPPPAGKPLDAPAPPNMVQAVIKAELWPAYSTASIKFVAILSRLSRAGSIQPNRNTP